MRYGVRFFTGLVFCAYLGGAGPAAADVVTDWNAIASQTTFSPSNPAALVRVGGTGILDLAMVHLAMHDAIQAYEGRYQSYAAPIPNATGSPVAAAASAAHDVLVNRFPGQAASLDTALQNYLAALGLPGDPGVAIGQVAAAQIVSLRTGDGSWPSNPEVFTGSTQPGEWRPTLPLFLPMQAPWLGFVAAFALKDFDQLYPSPPPPQLTGSQYTQEYNEVKALGRADPGSTRTQEQTDLARFYTENFFTLVERMMRGIASPSDVGANGRLFALANVAGADTLINTWNAKRTYNRWR